MNTSLLYFPVGIKEKKSFSCKGGLIKLKITWKNGALSWRHRRLMLKKNMTSKVKSLFSKITQESPRKHSNNVLYMQVHFIHISNKAERNANSVNNFNSALLIIKAQNLFRFYPGVATKFYRKMGVARGKSLRTTAIENWIHPMAGQKWSIDL